MVMKKQPLFEFADASGKTSVRTTIGFRLKNENFVELSRRAKVLGVSPHELARHYVLEILSEKEERGALREAVNALGEYLAEVRKDIALAAEALLTAAGTVEEKDAREWAKKNLNRD
jgi:hypothetical protein